MRCTYGSVTARGAARCGSLHLPVPPRFSYGRQWGATRTMPRTGHRGLRKAAANFAIGITYTEEIRGWSSRMQRDVLFTSWEKIADSYRRRTTRRDGLLSSRGAVLFLSFSQSLRRYALRGVTLLISSHTRLVYSTLISDRFLRRGRPIKKRVGDVHSDKRLPLHRLVVIFIFIVPRAIQGNAVSFMRSSITAELDAIGSNNFPDL